MKKNIKRKLFTFFVILQILVISGMPNSVYAFFSISGAIEGQIKDLLEGALGINIEETLAPMTKKLNSMDSKDQAPVVSITFSPSSPQPGEKVTATALVKGIINPDEAYYTWYIKRKDEEKLNKDGLEIMDFRKLLALKLLIKANSTYNPLLFDQLPNGGNGDGIVQRSEYPEDESDDGFIAYNGGQDKSGSSEDQYIYVYSKDCDDGKGCYFEVGNAKGGDLEYGQCDDGYTPMCLIEDNERTCPIYDPPVEGKASADSNGGSGGDGTNGGNGGASSSAVEIKEEGTSTNMRFSRCVGVSAPTCTSEGAVCNNGGSPYCVAKMSGSVGSFFSKLNDTCPDPFLVWKNWVEKGEVAGASCADFEGGGFSFLKEYECGEEPIEEEDYDHYNGPTYHLFLPESYNERNEQQPYGMPDGEFNLEAEIRLGLNPLVENTTGLSLNDEALVVGYKLDKFSWIYEDGDEIGVVVEGTAPVPTQHHDNTFQTVFAFMSNGCKVRRKGAYEIEVKGKKQVIRTARMDPPMLNDCLKNNLVKPGSNESRDLEITLNANVDFESAITSDEGNMVEINAQTNYNTGGTTNSSNLNYLWSFKCGSSANVCEEGKDITKQMSDLMATGKIKGNNIPLLQFQANFPNECFDSGGRGFACVDVKVNSSYKQDKSSFGTSQYPFPIQKSGGRIKAYIVGENMSTGEEICSDERNFALCRVLPGEIIKVEMPIPKGGDENFVSWFLNERQIDNCYSEKASECFIPIVYPFGTTLTVSATYSDPGEGTFSNKNISRVFVVKELEIYPQVVSGGSYLKMGDYVDEEGKLFADLSGKIIEYDSGNSLSLEVRTFRPASKNMKFEWTINGEKSFDPEISFVPESSNVSLKVLYDLSKENKENLKTLGISQYNFSPIYLSSNVTLRESSQSIAKKENKNFFATTARNTPAYFFFLLKTFFIISTMLFVFHLIFSLFNYGKRR